MKRTLTVNLQTMLFLLEKKYAKSWISFVFLFVSVPNDNGKMALVPLKVFETSVKS